MKRAVTPMHVGAIAVFLAVFVYAFSWPLALYVALGHFPHYLPYIEWFYRPALAIAAHCPPYLAILEWEAQLLGVFV